MGKDIDRNITRQLWERKNVVTGDVFTKNDVIPVENGGTGVTNIKDILPVITNGTKYIKRIHNTYKNEKLDKMVNAYIDINDNSIFLNMWDNYTVTGYETDTPLILAVFEDTGFMQNVRCSARYGYSNATITLYDGTITISASSGSVLNTIIGNSFRNFLLFHYKRRNI